jgi:hypothetical protein
MAKLCSTCSVLEFQWLVSLSDHRALCSRYTIEQEFSFRLQLRAFVVQEAPANSLTHRRDLFDSGCGGVRFPLNAGLTYLRADAQESDEICWAISFGVQSRDVWKLQYPKHTDHGKRRGGIERILMKRGAIQKAADGIHSLSFVIRDNPPKFPRRISCRTECVVNFRPGQHVNIGESVHSLRGSQQDGIRSW